MPLVVDVNWLAVLVAAIVAFVVGWLWWGPLFGKQWMKLSGRKPSKDMKKGMGSKMLIAFVANLIMAWVLAMLISSVAVVGIIEGAILAFHIWLGFVATIGVGLVLWDGKPWGLFWLNTLGWLVALVLMAVVLVMMG